MGLEGKVAWITGGGSGIGLAGALELARAGAHVIISGRNAQTNALALKQVQAVGRAELLPLEISDQKAVLKAARDILERHERMDILVNSAGTNLAKRFWNNVELEGWDEVVAVNLSGLFYCCYAVMPAMRAQKDGLIINISSWAARFATRVTGPAYDATKRGVIALTESINLEEGANGIRATTVLPGEVATGIMDKRPVPVPAEVRARMLQPEDLGQTILYLASLPRRACVSELVIAPTFKSGR